MSLRYMIEAALFFATMIYAQYEVSNLNQNLHVTIPDYTEFKAVQIEINSRSPTGTRILFAGADNEEERDEDDDEELEDLFVAFDFSASTDEELVVRKEELH